MKNKYKISIIGTRGIPNHHGGFEQFAEIASQELSKHFDITVYNSSEHNYKDSTYNNVNISHKWCKEKFIGASAHFIYDFLCLKDSLEKKNDIIIALGYGTLALSLLILKSKTSSIVVNMDGMEWQRKDISWIKKYLLIWSEKLVIKKADFIISDAIPIQKYYMQNFNKDTFYLPYGASIFKENNKEYISKLKLKEKMYFLLIARFDPSNNIEEILKGYRNSKQTYKLIIVGNYNNRYGLRIKKKYKSESIKFLGPIYNTKILNNLRFYSKLYFHGHSVGGTPPSLLEAMSCSAPIVAHDNIYNRDILESNAKYFKTSNDIEKIINKIDIKYNFFSNAIDNNLLKIRKKYLWEDINSSLINFIYKIKNKEI